MSEDGPSLFDALEAQVYREKVRRPRPAARAACGMCLTRLVSMDRHLGHLVWRLHNYETWGGTRVACQASAQRLCEAPARHVAGIETPVCTCTLD